MQIYGDGRVHLHYPVYMQRSGDYELELGNLELRQLLLSLAETGAMDFDAQNVGQLRQLEVERQIELLKGMAYEGYLMFEWPKLWDSSLGEPEKILPGVSEFLRARLSAKQAVLSAYKGDKRPPKFVERAAR